MLTCLVLPAGAYAALTWQDPAPVSQAGSNPEQAHVAMSSAGQAVAAWQQTDAGTSIWAALRPAGGNFAAPGTDIDGGTIGNDHHQAAMGPGGQAEVVWDGASGSSQIFGAFRSNGSFAAKQFVSNSSGLPLNPDTRVDSQGSALAVWRDGQFIWSGFRSVGDGTWGNRVVVSPNTSNADVPRLAIGGQDDAVAVWSNNLGTVGAPPNQRTIQSVEASHRRSGSGGIWDSTAAPITLCMGSTGSSPFPSCLAPQVAMGGQGEAVAVWSRETSTSGLGTGAIQARIRAPGTAGVWGGTQTLAAQSAKNPQVAMDGAGNAVAVWERQGAIESAYRPAGQSFGSVVPITTSDQTVTGGPRVAMSSSGGAVVVWSYDDGGQIHITSRYRAPGGTFDPAHEIAAEDPAGNPDVAMDAAGNAMVTWDGNLDGDLLIQASAGTVPGAPPPPPPPPVPQPPAPTPDPGVPTVTAVRAAAPITAGSPIVLTADVAGPVDRLEWDMTGGASVTGSAVNGRLPRSVRLHAQPGSLFVRVQAFGAGRTGPIFRRTFAVPRPKASSAAVGLDDVQRAIDRAPAVAAAGDTAVLLGKSSSCAIPTTIRSLQTVMSGCFKPVENLGDIPGAERGVLDSLSREFHVPLSDAGLMNQAIGMSDGYITQGQALLNDKWPVVPSGPADVLSFPQANALTSSNASVEVAGLKFGASPKGFSLDLDPKKSGIDLGQLPKPPKLPSIGGFELVGDWAINLGKQEATIKASLKLPKWITSAGVEIQNSVTLRATPTELKIEDVSVGPINVNLGGLDVSQFRIRFIKAEDTWQGQGKACIASGLCLDMVPPNGQVKIVHGALNFAGASLQFPPPGVPLFTGVNLERIGFGIGLDPTRFTGNAKIAVLSLVKLDGRIVVAFPSERTPFVLLPDEVGTGFPAKLYGTKFTRPVIGATAALSLALPGFELGLGSGYFLYHFPSYIAVGGGVKQDILDVVGFSGNVSGEANFSDGAINIHGDISVCLLHPHICGGAVANISRGPNNTGGAGGCISLGPLSVGGGVRWSGTIYIWPLDGCKWSRFAVDVKATRAQADAPRTIEVKAGQPSPVLKLYGQGGAPRVHIAGPGGQALDSTDKGIDFTPGGKIRIIRSEGANYNFTTIGIQNGQPGTYTVTPLPGSVPITKVERATDQPNASVTGRVTGRGTRRVLHYRVGKRDGQTVQFFDVGEGDASREIGHITGGGTGTIKFTAAPGQARRRIEAQFALEGINAERKVVTTFGPPSLTLPAPRGLRVKRSKKGPLTISWRGVAGATKYELAITSPSGYQRIIKTRKRRAVVKLAKSVGGRVTVRAAAPFRTSKVTAKPFKRLAPRATKFRTPKRCKVVKKKIVCRRA